jgi:hypothetical protein
MTVVKGEVEFIRNVFGRNGSETSITVAFSEGPYGSVHRRRGSKIYFIPSGDARRAAERLPEKWPGGVEATVFFEPSGREKPYRAVPGNQNG